METLKVKRPDGAVLEVSRKLYETSLRERGYVLAIERPETKAPAKHKSRQRITR